MIDQITEKGPRTTRAEGRQKNLDRQGGKSDERSQFSAPSISLPKVGMVERTHVTFTENGFTNAALESGDYRAPLPSESRAYELLKVRPSANVQGITNLFRFDELNSQITSASDQGATLSYQEWDADEESLPGPRRQLIERLPTLYRQNDLSDPLPLAVVARNPSPK